MGSRVRARAVLCRVRRLAQLAVLRARAWQPCRSPLVHADSALARAVRAPTVRSVGDAVAGV